VITARLSVEIGTKTRRRALFWLLKLKEFEADTVVGDEISDKCFLERFRVDFRPWLVLHLEHERARCMLTLEDMRIFLPRNGVVSFEMDWAFQKAEL
jgi:hypothetical protein